MASTRQQVLCLYRNILRIARNWKSINIEETAKERQYIKDEAKLLFHRNKQITNTEEIKQHIQEADARIEIALHYQNPYPRPINIPQHVLPPGKKQLKGTTRTLNQSKPIYIKSYDKER